MPGTFIWPGGTDVVGTNYNGQTSSISFPVGSANPVLITEYYNLATLYNSRETWLPIYFPTTTSMVVPLDPNWVPSQLLSQITYAQGNTVIGTHAQSFASHAISTAYEFTSSRSGNALGANFWMDGPSGNLQLAIYDTTGAGGAPNNLLGYTNSVAQVYGWNRIPYVSPIALASGTSYWLCFQASAGLTHNTNTGGSYYNLSSYGAFPSTFPTPLVGTGTYAYFAHVT
jgi:hypothetical protein